MSLNDPVGIACNTFSAVQNLPPQSKLHVNVFKWPFWHCLQHILCSSKPPSPMQVPTWGSGQGPIFPGGANLVAPVSIGGWRAFSYIFWSWYCVSSGTLLEDKITIKEYVLEVGTYSVPSLCGPLMGDRQQNMWWDCCVSPFSFQSLSDAALEL